MKDALINKALIQIEKAKRILDNLNHLPSSNAKTLIEDAITAIELCYDKEKENIHELYYTLKDMTHKKIEKSEKGIRISNWKINKEVAKEDLEKLLYEIEEFIKRITN